MVKLHLLLLSFCILISYIRVVWISSEAHHTLTTVTFRYIHKPTCYIISFILSSANNQQSVNMNWRKTTTKLMATLLSRLALFFTESFWSSVWGENSQWGLVIQPMGILCPTAQLCDCVLGECRVYLLDIWRGDVCSPSHLFHFIFQEEILLQPLWHWNLWEKK